MTELPPAVVHDAPFHKRSGFRKAIGAVLVIGALYGACRIAKPYLRSAEYKRLAAKFDQARAKVGDGLDDLFEALLSSESKVVDLRFKLTGEGAASDPAFPCATGLTAAFKDALGEELVSFSSLGSYRPAVELVIDGELVRSDRQYVLPHSTEPHRGFVLSGKVSFLDRAIPIRVEPPADIEFTHTRFGFDLSNRGLSASDVDAGIMQGTCRELGYTLLEQMTSWKRPAPVVRDALADCERGFRCRESAESLEDSDPAKAAKLYAKACEHDDDAACVRFGALELPHAKGISERSSRVQFALEMACTKYLPGACRMAGAVAAAREYGREDALNLYLRACDLHDEAGCEGAAELLKGTPFAEAAPLLTGKQSVATKAFGTAIALRWGQWWRLDRGQPTLWVTRRPASLPQGAFVRELRGDEIPKSIRLPGGDDIVYAVGLHSGREACQRCNPSGRSKSLMVMSSFDCVCAIDKAVRD